MNVNDFNILYNKIKEFCIDNDLSIYDFIDILEEIYSKNSMRNN